MAEKIAIEVIEERKAKHSIWTFDDWDIPNRSELIYVDDPTITCKVYNRRKVEYKGDTYYMTPFAKKITGNNSIVHGPGFFARHFTYNGELIEDIEKRIANLKKSNKSKGDC